MLFPINVIDPTILSGRGNFKNIHKRKGKFPILIFIIDYLKEGGVTFVTPRGIPMVTFVTPRGTHGYLCYPRGTHGLSLSPPWYPWVTFVTPGVPLGYLCPPGNPWVISKNSANFVKPFGQLTYIKYMYIYSNI